jgi:hypothetical protein
MPQVARSAFQTAPGPKPGSRSTIWRKAVGLDPHILEDATRFRGEGAPRALHLPMLAEAERVERSRPSWVIVGFKPTKHATCEPLDWRRADHSKAMPHDGTHRLATACRTPPASLSMDWSPTEDLHLTTPAYKAGAPLSVRDGHIGGSPRNRTWITPLKRRVSVSLS